MKVILLERIGKHGTLGETIRVRDGFARNYLLPQGKALRATKENQARFDRERADLDRRFDRLSDQIRHERRDRDRYRG